MSKSNLTTILKNYNVEGNVYLSDVHIWIGLENDMELAKELQEKLTELRDYYEDSRFGTMDYRNTSS